MKGGRPGSNRRRGAHNPGCFRLHHGHHEAGTTGLEPAASRLTSECSARLSYAPESGAGGIRTHGLELMRLARTAAPLPRTGLAGRSRTCGLRRPKPAGWPVSPTARSDTSTPGGTRTRSFRVEGPASSPLRPRGHEAPAAGLEPALSRVTVARLANSTTPERTAEGEGVEPPRPERPTRFRDGIPRRWQSFHGVAPAGVEPATLRLRGGSSAS